MHVMRLNDFQAMRSFVLVQLPCADISCHALEVVRRLCGGHQALLQILCADLGSSLGSPPPERLSLSDVLGYLAINLSRQREQTQFEPVLSEFMRDAHQAGIVIAMIEAFRDWDIVLPTDSQFTIGLSDLRERLTIRDLPASADELVHNGALRTIGERGRYAFNISFPHLISVQWFTNYRKASEKKRILKR